MDDSKFDCAFRNDAMHGCSSAKRHLKLILNVISAKTVADSIGARSGLNYLSSIVRIHSRVRARARARD